jgi:hypothetical protein
MEKLTIKLIKKNGYLEYSILEQSEGLRNLVEDDVFTHFNGLINGTKFYVSSTDSPSLYSLRYKERYIKISFRIRGSEITLDNRVSYRSIKEHEKLISILNKETFALIKKYLKEKDIEFKVVTNLFSANNFNSRF